MTTSTEIKVGTRVRIGADNGGYDTRLKEGLWPGNTGVVAYMHRPGVYSVRTDNAEYPTDGDSLGWTFYDYELEVIE